MAEPHIVLLIEDNLEDRERYLRVLKKNTEMQYHCLEASDGRAGIDLCNAKPVDCVLLDYSLPGMNGLDVLKALRARQPFLPVILLTGQGNESVAAEAIKQGAYDYLTKSAMTTERLQHAINVAIEQSAMKRSIAEKDTQLVQKSEVLEQYRAQLEQSNHDLEQFAHIVAHDLKSPLRAVTQHLAIVAEKNGALFDEKSKRSLDFAVEGAARMRKLIDALFEYARLGFSEPEFTSVSLEALLKQTKSDLFIVIEERGARITHSALPEVKGDAILLAQLLQNLVANAIKYCEQAPQIHISALQKDGAWTISVEDNGIGIPKAQHEKIFAIFRRLHVESDYPGIGLGLAICDRIVKQHGGNIEVQSEPGKGSCFRFTLPTNIEVSPQNSMRAYG